eukprot:GGOE01016060.1.p3 GENE.GGOE01016060.1~~GGOE01016060.1.p3  ORF type:complete len:119 (-),score=5.93 GGOE01016060.1:65-421(-)
MATVAQGSFLCLTFHTTRSALRGIPSWMALRDFLRVIPLLAGTIRGGTTTLASREMWLYVEVPYLFRLEGGSHSGLPTYPPHRSNATVVAPGVTKRTSPTQVHAIRLMRASRAAPPGA